MEKNNTQHSDDFLSKKLFSSLTGGSVLGEGPCIDAIPAPAGGSEWGNGHFMSLSTLASLEA